jgi:hypothetical protein
MYKKVEPILFGPHTGTRDLKEAIWTIICADLDRDTAVATHRVAFFTKEKCVQRVEAVKRRREMRRRRRRRARETWTVIVHTRCHLGVNLPANYRQPTAFNIWCTYKMYRHDLPRFTPLIRARFPPQLCSSPRLTI